MKIEIDPGGLRSRAGSLRTIANDLSSTASEIQSALGAIGQSSSSVTALSPVVSALRSRALDLEYRASFVENNQPIDLVATAPSWTPTNYDDLGATADDLALLITDVERRIDNWHGTDNDPILDELIRTETELKDQLATAQGLPTEFQPDVLRLYQLFAIAGLGGPEYSAILEAIAGGEAVPPAYVMADWLAETHPELAERRAEIIAQVIELEEQKAALGTPTPYDPAAPQSTLDYLGQQHLLANIAEIDEKIEALYEDWQAPSEDFEELIAPLTDEERDRLLGLVLLAKLTLGDLPEGMQPYVDSELIRIRTEWAINVYTGGGPEDPVDAYMDAVEYGPLADFMLPRRTRELGEIIDALDPPGQPGVLTAFLDGLILGDIIDADYEGGSGFAHMVGAIVSGELIYGDVRDVVANLAQGDWGNAALAGAGFIPLVGSLRHGDEAVDIVRRIDEAAETLETLSKSDLMIRARGVTDEAYRAADEVLADIGTHGFSDVALDNGIPALATVMTKDELAATLVELRRLDTERLDAIAAIDELLETGDLSQGAASQLRRTRNSLEANLKTDDLVGAIRDREGIPVYQVSSDGSSVRKVEHDTEVLNGLVSLENATSLDLADLDFDLQQLFDSLEVVVGTAPNS